ncbi:MAG TPA: cell division protein CrgA [Mycobacteriales bacterium]|nr:cell division protein CrgA [Mycobacteriales bacterium]
MPKSRVRKKSVYTPPSDVLPPATTQSRRKGPSPAWYPPAIGVVLVLGLAYIVTNYLAGDKVPIMKSLAGWNFAVGFGLLILGLGMAVRWR